MAHTHTEFQEGCFSCKLKTLSFGVVPGAYRDSVRTYYDKDTLPDFPSKEEVMDNRSDFWNAPEKEMHIDAEGRLV